MRHLRFCLLAFLFVIIAGYVPAARAEVSLDPRTAPYGLYRLDPDHTSITFKINHLGFSHYTGRFDKVEGYVNFNSNSPEQSNVNIVIYPNSVDTNNPKLEEDLRTAQWFNVIQFPRATFHSTRIDQTGAMTGKVKGDFTFLGITRALTLDVTFIGTGINPITHKQVIGFSAHASLDRSDYGLSNLLPALGNEVVLEIETELDKD